MDFENISRQISKEQLIWRELRLAVLGELIGRELASTHDLYKWEAHTLIEYLQQPGTTELSYDGTILLHTSEALVTDRVKDELARRAQARREARALRGVRGSADRRDGNARSAAHQGGCAGRPGPG